MIRMRNNYSRIQRNKSDKVEYDQETVNERRWLKNVSLVLYHN